MTDRRKLSDLSQMVWGSDIFYPPVADVTGMDIPVLCRCGEVYDMAAVNVTARHADCSVWKAPCCGREDDSRPGGIGYTRLDSEGRPVR